MDSGFIVLHRKILDSYLATSPFRLALWVALISLASHKDKEFIFHGEKITLKRGQFITGRKVLSAKTGISESYIEKLLKEFENYGMLEQQKTNRNRLITIINYKKYQDKEQQRDITETSQRHHRDTINNYNNDNNIKRGNKSRFAPPSPTDLKNYISSNNYLINAETFLNFYESKGWMVGKNKMKDWKAAVRQWHSRNKPTKTTKEDYFRGKKPL